MSDWIEEAALRETAEQWVAKVKAAYAEGEYDLIDVMALPVDEMEWLLAQRREALAKIDRLHQVMNHLDRIVEANPSMRIADAMKLVTEDGPARAARMIADVQAEHARTWPSCATGHVSGTETS